MQLTLTFRADGSQASETAIGTGGHNRTRSRHQIVNEEWFPWPDKITCTLDILMHLPRSVFSERQIDILLWLLRVNNVDDVPSVKSVKLIKDTIQRLCGIRSIPYDGALGHKYYVNSLPDIIRQEMMNPRVRPLLHFYPEDTGMELNEARQAKRWLEELDPELLTPVARLHNQDFFVFEPALLLSGRACIPFRWFTRGGKMYTKAWSLRPVTHELDCGWVVEDFRSFEVSEDDLLVSFKNWDSSEATSGLPRAHSIYGVEREPNGELQPWTLTNPSEGNKWRVRASGARVYAMPLWLYCDDTSGNLSKKWNKHNSFLFTAAGLPRAEVHHEYNVHFLCTSNLAPPLEMLDGIVDQLEESWKQGIWAWDCVHEEYILVIPSVLALLGDNPMQSEMACHIGSMGKYFCRMCKVKGHDASAESNPARAAAAQPDDTDHSVGEVSGSEPEAHTDAPLKSTRKRAKETMEEMVTRVKRFVKIGEPRHKNETVSELKSMFSHASTVGNQTQIKQWKTSTGIKDTFLDSFLNRLAESHCKIRGGKAKQEALDRVKETLPENVTSPVWRIKGIDPHADTPVEILHTVLLGFVKYLWRDVVSVRIGKDKLKRELLETRLSSVDVSGLGLSHLAGHTLVQYAGSLVGRDFRAIAQVAPFVLHDLVPTECYDTWVALSNLIPLIWQPEIENSTEHLRNLTTSINNFLACTARWTPRWFNKPKFHILLHVVDHIQRFGPATLFATEAFESFNAVIRAKSIHSNHRAPSRDIARSFAHGSRIRHILSGARILIHDNTNDIHSDSPDLTLQVSNPLSDKPPDAINVQVVGKGPLSLVQRPNIITDYLGLDTQADTTKYGKLFPNALRSLPNDILRGHNFRTCKSVVLFNGDICKIGDWVIAAKGTAEESPIVACIREIIQRQGSDADKLLRPDAILLERGSVGEPAVSYSMPAVRAHGGFLLYPVEQILCAANLQHQCQAHNCTSSPSDIEFVYEERAKTSKAKAVIRHIGDPDDLVLNTARMRDAKHMQGLRVPVQPPDMNLAILEGAAREIRTRNNTTSGASVTSTGSSTWTTWTGSRPTS
ncbi:hypothetical protein DEU56DRAFT_743067 [Suillus clintonianus]|uniref:uncharacterized protein n=1 Tax=Suillus clintonianus TaxID=1904413 RepID=UPI001B86254D|nr:uncharacterized protein DEU56DRAFT_743067 [Suillus clintonianus]KAG2126284.1 hypothetical protein DEU56DRAFT_743067 [Suillus clintonianus]